VRHTFPPALFRALAIAAVCAAIASAQVNKSNLTGVVQDGSGSAVPGALMHLTNVGTGATRTETTDATGLYRFTLLDNGSYRLEAEHPGFKKAVRNGIELETGQTTTVDMTMALGEITESIQVTAESPILQTETGSSGTTVTTQVINELPLIGRNPYVFLTLSPGIQYTGNPAAINPYDNNGVSGFSSSGSSSQSEFLLDGMPNMKIDVVSFSPSPDAVQEMRVQTNAYDAEYGHTGGAFVNVSTRSGTNQLHGSAYWFLRNDNLNANSFFNNRNGATKSENKRNTYGGSLGGPVWLPKLFNGRNRTFYFVNYEGTQIRGASYLRTIVPTLLERNGDFSQTRDLQGRPFTIYDPATTRPNGSAYVRDPFPGNQIPKERMDSVALRALAYYPLPNLVRTSTSQLNFQNPTNSGLEFNSMMSRVDHRLNDAHTLFFRFGWNHRFDPSGAPYGDACCRAAGNPGSDGQDLFARGNIAAGVGYTWIASTRTVADFRLGVTRYFDGDYLFGEGFDPSTLGFPASFTRSIAFAQFPRFEMTSGDVDNLGPGRTPAVLFVNVYNPLVNIHTMLGRHSLKYGARYQQSQQNTNDRGRSAGRFQFSRAFTQGPDPTRTAANSGNDFASFLLGLPSSGYTDINAAPALQNKYFGTYIQDDWKATNRLTLNMGVRFEHETPVTDRFNRGSAGLDFSAANPLTAQVAANYAANPIPELASLNIRGGLRFLGVGDAPRGQFNMESLNIAPRFGYALRLTNRVVWRGGYGLFYIPNNVSNFRLDGYSLQTRMVTSLDNNLTPFNRLSDPFPNGLVRPPGASGGVLTAVGQSLTAGGIASGSMLPDCQHGISQQFSTGFQVVLPHSISFEAAYVGNLSQRLTITRNINQYPDRYLALGNRLNARVPNPFYGVITDPTSSLSQATTTVSQLLKPFPQYTGLTESALPYGRSNYNSLQAQVSKRMAKGLTFGSSYTFSKYMDATSYLNANDAAPAHVISSADRPHRLVVYGLYELPFGPGKPIASTNNPVIRHVIGGWQANWLWTLQSGAPLSFSGSDRVTKSGNNPQTVDQWFDVKQFVPVQPFTLTQLSARLADLRAPRLNKWDITAMKAFRINEGVDLKFRAEFYNAFNHTNFGSPNTTVTSASFGRITSTFLGPREIQLALRLVF
jgi:hypothetical protein